MKTGCERESARDVIAEVSRGVEAPKNMEEVIGLFESQSLGRAIYAHQVSSESSDLLPAESTQIGYVLPLSPDQTKHLVILSTRTIFVINPHSQDDETVTHYKSYFLQSNHPIKLTLLPEDYENAADIMAYQLTGKSTTFGSSEVLRNNTAQNSSQITEAFQAAFVLAHQLRDERIQEEVKSESFLIDFISQDTTTMMRALPERVPTEDFDQDQGEQSSSV